VTVLKTTLFSPSFSFSNKCSATRKRTHVSLRKGTLIYVMMAAIIILPDVCLFHNHVGLCFMIIIALWLFNSYNTFDI